MANINQIIEEKIKKHATVFVINTENIRKNYQVVKKTVGKNVAIGVVLKNNAYGIGVDNVYPIFKDEGETRFFVATIEEALKLKNLASAEDEIIVLHGVLENQEKIFYENNFIPSLNTISQLKRWNNLAKAKGEKLQCYLHFETGMNRLGFIKNDIKEILANINNLEVQYIISHFACASIKGHPSLEDQYVRFKEVAEYFPNTKKSLCASEGVFLDDKYHFDMVRVGLYFYGGKTEASETNRVINLYSSIVQIKTLEVGESLGYGHTWIAKRVTKIAVLPCGYGDGLMRAASNKGVFYIKGQPVKVIGTVSMDLVMVDITDLAEEYQKEGEIVEILGEHNSLAGFANRIGVGEAELMRGLTTRYPRVFI